jgi:hypothetical protein
VREARDERGRGRQQSQRELLRGGCRDSGITIGRIATDGMRSDLSATPRVSKREDGLVWMNAAPASSFGHRFASARSPSSRVQRDADARAGIVADPRHDRPQARIVAVGETALAAHDERGAQGPLRRARSRPRARLASGRDS